MLPPGPHSDGHSSSHCSSAATALCSAAAVTAALPCSRSDDVGHVCAISRGTSSQVDSFLVVPGGPVIAGCGPSSTSRSASKGPFASAECFDSFELHAIAARGGAVHTHGPARLVLVHGAPMAPAVMYGVAFSPSAVVIVSPHTVSRPRNRRRAGGLAARSGVTAIARARPRRCPAVSRRADRVARRAARRSGSPAQRARASRPGAGDRSCTGRS
jgi:hypothetical protein